MAQESNQTRKAGAFKTFSSVSVIVPAYNEEDNVEPLYREITAVMKKIGLTYEIIFVDDGSSDATFSEMKKVASGDDHVKVIKFRANFGQTAGWAASFDHAKYDVIVGMDADLQNDPRDIPKMLAKMDSGYDVISGWRKHRKDPLSKKIPSYFSNKIRMSMTGEKIHDSGCALKAYRSVCLKDLHMYGEMHRYITALLLWKGFRIGEVVVNHRSRKFGRTKYNISRIFKGLMDLLVVVFWKKYSTRPIHVFGGIGVLMFLAGLAGSIYSLYLKLFLFVDLSDTFLPTVSLMFILISFQLLMTGFLADIMIKNYYANHESYSIEQIVSKSKK